MRHAGFDDGTEVHAAAFPRVFVVYRGHDAGANETAMEAAVFQEHVAFDGILVKNPDRLRVRRQRVARGQPRQRPAGSPTGEVQVGANTTQVEKLEASGVVVLGRGAAGCRE